MRRYLGILTLALGTATAWAQDFSTAPAHINLLLQTNFAAREKAPVAFSVRRAEIVLSGDASPRLGFLVNYDPAASGLKDAKVRYAYRPELAVAAGRFKYPQGLEGRTPSGQLLFIERSDLGSTFGDQRAYGLEVGGRAGVLEYAAAAINDWSNDRTWTARLGIHDDRFVLGTSGLYGPTYRGANGGSDSKAASRSARGPGNRRSATGRTTATTPGNIRVGGRTRPSPGRSVHSAPPRDWSSGGRTPPLDLSWRWSDASPWEATGFSPAMRPKAAN